MLKATRQDKELVTNILTRFFTTKSMVENLPRYSVMDPISMENQTWVIRCIS